MELISEYRSRVESGGVLGREDILRLAGAPLEELCDAADGIRRRFCGNKFDLCMIINGRSGRCPENCRYCAQSAYYPTQIQEYSLIDSETVLHTARHNEPAGILRFSIVTSGRKLSDEEVDQVCESYRRLKQETGFHLCASHGLLTGDQFERIKEAGVTRYHNNLETSRRFFPSVCTTHSYDDKLAAIRAAKDAGLEVCSGGIIGMGETLEDRIDMLLELRGLGIRSIPVNVLSPIVGTPFASLPPLGLDEIQRTIALFRFLLPDGAIRMAAGRRQMADRGERLFRSGCNAAITGDLLTTAGVETQRDLELIKGLGYEVERI